MTTAAVLREIATTSHELEAAIPRAYDRLSEWTRGVPATSTDPRGGGTGDLSGKILQHDHFAAQKRRLLENTVLLVKLVRETEALCDSVLDPAYPDPLAEVLPTVCAHRECELEAVRLGRCETHAHWWRLLERDASDEFIASCAQHPAYSGTAA